MSDFDPAVAVVLQHEGGWVDDPADAGGETNFGWSMSTIRSLGLSPRELGLDQDDFTPGCLRAMTRETATSLYRAHFWVPYRYSLLADQRVATKVFDAAVNMGPHRACVFAQLSAEDLGAGVGLRIDGVLGPDTAAAINGCPEQAFLDTYGAHLAGYYRALAKGAQAKFLPNWLHRAAWGVSQPLPGIYDARSTSPVA